MALWIKPKFLEKPETDVLLTVTGDVNCCLRVPAKTTRHFYLAFSNGLVVRVVIRPPVLFRACVVKNGAGVRIDTFNNNAVAISTITVRDNIQWLAVGDSSTFAMA